MVLPRHPSEGLKRLLAHNTELSHFAGIVVQVPEKGYPDTATVAHNLIGVNNILRLLGLTVIGGVFVAWMGRYVGSPAKFSGP